MKNMLYKIQDQLFNDDRCDPIRITKAPYDEIVRVFYLAVYRPVVILNVLASCHPERSQGSAQITITKNVVPS
jgi:hypothetical protein